MHNRYRVKPGHKVDLDQCDPDETGGRKKEDIAPELAQIHERLADLQGRLYAEHRHKVLVVLQAPDTGGKDGTIRSVFSGVNPQGVRVHAFKKPTAEESDHDYLWRVHAHTPGSGEIVVFNRSHYEDVLVVRVHDIIDQKTCRRRYQHINHFEEMLTDEGTTILKFFLHISKAEQKERLEKRLEEPDKRWKISPADLAERKLWGKYREAYEAMLEATSTEHSPWYVIPANHKPYRNLVVAHLLVKALEDLDMQLPEPQMDLSDVVIE